MPSPLQKIERARPLLGTTVTIRVAGLNESDAHYAINDAFSEIALVHRLMSFQEAQSDVSRVNCNAYDRTQTVHPETYEVLSQALAISAATEGAFDVTIAPKLVEWGLLPSPPSRHIPHAKADWRDIELGKNYQVRFHRPLWIDLSGIAKGFAVDRAIDILTSHGASQSSVNAGGDLRIHGSEGEQIYLRCNQDHEIEIPMLEVANAAVASSEVYFEENLVSEERHGTHIDPRNRTGITSNCFATVIAKSCLVADALTKPVLILGKDCSPLLRQFEAMAHYYDPVQNWVHMTGSA